MPQQVREIVPHRAGLVEQVGVANAAGLNANQHFSRAGRLDVDFLQQRRFTGAAGHDAHRGNSHGFTPLF
jgi:hypothetical protein